jgi:hypothetical protein
MPKTRLVCVAAVLLIGACGSPTPSSAKDQVATLASAAPTTAATHAAGAGGNRPQLRLDTSSAERDRLFTAYDDCLVAHGVKVNPVNQAGPAGPGRRLDQSGEPKSAYVACTDKLPRQPPELDEDLNPNYAAQWNDNVKCLRAHGLMVHVTEPGSWTWDSSNTVVPANEEAIENGCLLETFGGANDSAK